MKNKDRIGIAKIKRSSQHDDKYLADIDLLCKRIYNIMNKTEDEEDQSALVVALCHLEMVRRNKLEIAMMEIGGTLQ